MGLCTNEKMKRNKKKNTYPSAMCEPRIPNSVNEEGVLPKTSVM